MPAIFVSQGEYGHVHGRQRYAPAHEARPGDHQACDRASQKFRTGAIAYAAPLISWKPDGVMIDPWAEERNDARMNLQPVFEAAEQTERGAQTRRSWSIDELRERLGVAAPAAEEQARYLKQDTAIRPRIVLRGIGEAAA